MSEWQLHLSTFLPHQNVELNEYYILALVPPTLQNVDVSAFARLPKGDGVEFCNFIVSSGLCML